MQVGFPVDSEFARGEQPESPDESTDWVLGYGFIARDERRTYHVEFSRRKSHDGPGEFGSVFVWKMHFSPRESKSLKVQYHISMSMGLVDMQKGKDAKSWTGAFGQEFMNIGQLEMAGYVTSTGSSWAGNVEKARFRLITDLFERYLKYRGITEERETEMDAEEADRFKSSFPVLHPWWFREIKPEGWQIMKNGVEWNYNDYKPRDPIEVRYYETQFPDSAEEVNVFVDRFLQGLGPGDSAAKELRQLREVLLATYGKQPEDKTAREFASAQLWYTPSNNFSISDLTDKQKAVLKAIDERITH